MVLSSIAEVSFERENRLESGVLIAGHGSEVKLGWTNAKVGFKALA